MSQSTPAILRHVVLFAFKSTASPQAIAAIEAAFCALPQQIDLIDDFEWGTDVSVEGISQGFTHCFFVSFRSEADRDAYLPHPAHQAFVTQLRPIVDKVLVLDYWAR